MSDPTIEMTVEELQELQETYGADDPDIKAALELASAEAVVPTETGEGDLENDPENQKEEPTASPADDSGAVEPAKETEKEEKQKEFSMVPIAALHNERRRRREAEARAQQMEALQRNPAIQTGPQAPIQSEGPAEQSIEESPGRVARMLFFKEQKREPDFFDPDDNMRLQELTSLVTAKQLESRAMQQKVQVERMAFASEVQELAQEIKDSPEMNDAIDIKFAAMPEGPAKRLLYTSVHRLVSGTAERDDLDLVKDFCEEIRQSITAPPVAPTEQPKKPKAPLEAAYNMPKTQDVGAGNGGASSKALDLIEQKLDRGEKLTPEEEKIITALEI